jgi:O-antigen/teichoic acid export membrane protein
MSTMTGLIVRYSAMLRNYASLLSGSVGRLVFSLVYFLVLANTLSVADFGIIGAASAIGVVLSRVGGLGFWSPLYRISTVKPQLIGVYLGGYLGLLVLSLPLVALLAFIAFSAIFDGHLSAKAFGLIVISEVIFWRTAEIVIIINNGLRRFTLSAIMTIFGTFMRMLAALVFWKLASDQTVELWAWYYLTANAASLALIGFSGRIKNRIRFVWKLYPRRLREAFSVVTAEIIFYSQMELDKVLMLGLAGGEVTGIYVVIMRLVDLTAMPLRAFNTLLVQAIMRAPDMMQSWKLKLAMEGGIALVSTAALGAAAVLLWYEPTMLGKNIALVAPVLMFALAIPATRNITEYHSDLLYARGQTISRAGLLALLGGMKAVLMAQFIRPDIGAIELVVWMSGVFFVLYVVSAGFTYGLIRKPVLRA